MAAQAQAQQEVDTRTVLRHWLNEGWKYREINKKSKALQAEYKERVEYEFGLMESKDFLDYFAVLGDVVRKAKDQGVAVGPARGSAAASLCCFLWRITEVNPMDYPSMLFERFIAPDRNDEPDIDLDFEDERRDEVRQIMIKKYGIERVGNIGTFTRYRGKNAIDDVARVYGVPAWEVAKAKEFLVERSGGDSRFDAGIEDTVEMFPQVKELFDKYPDMYRAMELEGNYKAFGVHAAGLVIGAQPLDQYVATYEKNNVGANNNTVRVLSVDKYDGEHLGLMKLDALGLTTMGMLANAMRMLNMDLEELYDIPMDDPKTLQAFKIADVTGIFQFEGRTTKMVCQEMAPDTFMDLAAINALSRPGPLHSGSTGDYLAVRKGQQVREDIHPMVAKICEFTEGQIIYQEQILQICGDIGKLPWTHRSAIRKIISSKKGESAFNALWEQFYEGAASQGISEPIAKEIWKRMVTAGTYAFNIAHCVSYSMLGFWSMWLKVHHPVVFYAAQLQKAKDKDKIIALMKDMQDSRYGRSLRVLPPTLAESGVTWTPVEGGVRAGFLQIPGVGEKTAIAIAEAHKERKFTSWVELMGSKGGVKGVGKTTVEKMEAFSTTEDPFGIDKVAKDIRAIKRAISNDQLPGAPLPKQTSDDVPYEDKPWRGVIIGRLKDINLKDLFEDHRSRTGEDLDPATVKRPELKDSVTLYLEDALGTLTVKVNRHSYPKFKDKVWSAKKGEDYFLCVVKKFPFLGKTVHVENMWVINPD
jgi:DNA polymerase-3 subunit alpha